MVMVSTADAVAAAAETYGDDAADEIAEGVNPSCSFA